ncbi:hypothetical protein [Undibacterium sp. WLHG33]|uniref:hypothetical protein n=1 Tax=Undibacterium sp. WLHG33 TaxID=3412482 RepID=UPI003C2E3897
MMNANNFTQARQHQKVTQIRYDDECIYISFDDEKLPSLEVGIEEFKDKHMDIYAKFPKHRQLQFEASLSNFYKFGSCI